MPYGFGVYLSNITRAQLEKSFPPEAINELFPASQVICKDELSEFMTKEKSLPGSNPFSDITTLITLHHSNSTVSDGIYIPMYALTHPLRRLI